jgi:PAS domain S-box-containing protein
VTEDSAYLLSPLRGGADFTHYRGRERATQMPILAVAVTSDHPSPQNLRRLEHEYSLASELDEAWAAQPLALTRDEGRTLLILSDPGGEPLDRLIEKNKGRPFDLAQLLTIAIGLATALGRAHRQGIIHKDVKPANALVGAAGQVWLTGFGIASQAPRERPTPTPPEIIAGTLAYMSPEQTGRMNRSIDARSDLYSLGVTLYEMLTGETPFAATTPLEWVHCHIARQPMAPADRRPVPSPLSAVTMRLLAKNAEERYQTAEGLEADLRRCLLEWQSQGRIDPFPLGTNDLSDLLLIPERLYGRERAVDTLLAAFDQVATQGAAELVLVSGYSGVGKSSVVGELEKMLVPSRGLFASGKFDRYNRDIPYATLAQAFQMLVRQILVKSNAEVDDWRGAFHEALGPNGQLIVNLVPELEFIIGNQPAVGELPPQESRGRFQRVFRSFLDVFARPEHPLALFLDDMQWLDTASLEFLERLVTDPNSPHVLLIGAYRDNEVSSTHALMRTIAAIRNTGVGVRDIVLAPLELDDIERFISDALHCTATSAGPLAKLVYDKTGGNPFFTIQLLATLAEEGLLHVNPDAGSWTWDLGRIRAKGYSKNVVELMLSKLRRLSQPTQTALQQFACLGNAADAATLGLACGRSEDEIHATYLEAVRAGLIVRLEASYAFLHDRIREAAYALTSENARAEAHHRIGRLLLANLSAEGLTEHLFDVANQLNRAADCLVDRGAKLQTSAIDLRAGRKAKASGAFDSALAYFAAGMALLDDADWTGEYDLTFDLWVERTECELLCGNLERAAQLLAELLPRAVSKADEGAVYCLIIQLQIVKSEHEQAVVSSLAWLRGFGIDLPAHPTADQVRAEYDAVWLALDGRSIESLIDLPLLTDPDMLVICRVFSILMIPATLTDYNLGCILTCRLVAVSLQHGVSEASTSAYSIWWFGPGSVFRDYDDANRLAKLATDLVEKHGFIANQMLVYAGAAVVATWMQSLSNAIDFIQKALGAAISTGDFVSACFNMVVSNTFRLLRSDPLDVVLREAELALAFTHKAQIGGFAGLIESQQRFIAAMQGGPAAGWEPLGEAHLAERQMPMLTCMSWILKLEALLRLGDVGQALTAADNAKPLLPALAGHINVLDYTFYTALAVSAAYGTASADQQAVWRKVLADHCEQLSHWAENHPPTFADKLALVSAEIARIENRDVDAMRQYEEAVTLARENGFVKNEGLAHELAAQYYLTRGIDTAGFAHLRNARNCYDRWGAHGKVKQLDERYPRLRHESSLVLSTTTAHSVVQLDVETVVKASQALSSEMDIARLIEKLMQIAVENAGADRGLLVLMRDGEPWIEAEARIPRGSIEVFARQSAVTPTDLPQSVLYYAIRTQERVLLDDALDDDVHSKDDYVQRMGSKSVLCLPIVQQKKLVGLLYLENTLSPRVFTPSRVAVLELLASQAAISLENAALYTDIQISKEALEEAQHLSNMGSYSWFTDSDESFLSDELCRIMGFDRQAPTYTEQFFARIHPDDLPLANEQMQTVFAGRDIDFVIRWIMPDGSIKYLHNFAHGARTRNGRPELIGSILDVTQSKLAEAALIASEVNVRRANGYLTEAQRLTKTGSFSWIADTDELDFSEELCRIFEIEAGEPLTLDRISERMHPDDLPRMIEQVESLRNGHDVDCTIRLRMPDGSIKHLHAIAHRADNDLGRHELVGSAQDITESKLAEEALRASETNLREITETIPEMLWSASPDGAIDYCNGRFLEYTGFSHDQAMGNGWANTLHPDDRGSTAKIWKQCVKSGAPYRDEVRTFHAADHTYRWCVVRALPLRDLEGRILRWHGTVVDMHDWKRAQEDVRQAQADLAHVSRVATLNAMTASIAHEVSQPLSGILTNASTGARMLATNPPNLDGAAETIRRTIRDANRAAEMLNRIRAMFSKTAPTVEMIDLNETAQEVIALSAGELQKRGALLQTDFGGDLPLIRADRVQMQQVIMNLLLNAADAMLEVEDRPRTLLVRTGLNLDGSVELAVRDSGTGVDPDAMERLFEAFYTTKANGMGVGLSICRSIIESHDGRLWAAPNDGPGATFSFCVPNAPVLIAATR